VSLVKEDNASRAALTSGDVALNDIGRVVCCLKVKVNVPPSAKHCTNCTYQKMVDDVLLSCYIGTPQHFNIKTLQYKNLCQYKNTSI
jgi:hypothetical protein